MTTENKKALYQRSFNHSIEDIKEGMRLEGAELSNNYLTLVFRTEEDKIKNISLRLSEIYHLDLFKLITNFKHKKVRKIKILETALFINSEIFLESYALLYR